MEPVSMDVVLERIPNRKEGLNLRTGVFLKSVYFLSVDCSKTAIVGIFKHRGTSLGVAFAGKKSCIFWSNDTFTHFAVHFNEITASLETKTKQYYKLETGEEVMVRNYFGKMHVILYDGEHTITLDTQEWAHFTNNLPLLNKELCSLFMSEDIIQNFIRDLFTSEESVKPITDQLPVYYINRLVDEVALYKRWPNGGGC